MSWSTVRCQVEGCNWTASIDYGDALVGAQLRMREALDATYLRHLQDAHVTIGAEARAVDA